jgi:hypothetical protein
MNSDDQITDHETPPPTAVELRDLPKTAAASPSPPPREERAGERRPFSRAFSDSMAVMPARSPESAAPAVEKDSSPTNPSIHQSIDPPPSHPAFGAAYRGNGFVARLPKTMRDQLNQMMLDGVSYPEIIKCLGDPASHLKPDHLYQWKKRGHQDWLVQQDWLAERRARQESAADLIQDCDATQANQGALHLGTLYIFDALRDLRAGSLDDKLGGDCAAFARLLNALSRASRETLQLQKYRDACLQAKAALQPMRDPKRKLTDEERQAIVRNVDEILGLVPRSPSTPDDGSTN